MTVLNQDFLNGAIPGLFFIYFRVFKQTLQFLQQIGVWKKSIQYTVPGFEPTTFVKWVSFHNLYYFQNICNIWRPETKTILCTVPVPVRTYRYRYRSKDIFWIKNLKSTAAIKVGKFKAQSWSCLKMGDGCVRKSKKRTEREPTVSFKPKNK